MRSTGIQVVEEAEQEYARLYTLHSSKCGVQPSLVSLELDSHHGPILMEVGGFWSYFQRAMAIQSPAPLWYWVVLLFRGTHSGTRVSLCDVTHKSQQSQLSLLVVKGAGHSFCQQLQPVQGPKRIYWLLIRHVLPGEYVTIVYPGPKVIKQLHSWPVTRKRFNWTQEH